MDIKSICVYSKKKHEHFDTLFAKFCAFVLVIYFFHVSSLMLFQITRDCKIFNVNADYMKENITYDCAYGLVTLQLKGQAC